MKVFQRIVSYNYLKSASAVSGGKDTCSPRLTICAGSLELTVEAKAEGLQHRLHSEMVPDNKTEPCMTLFSSTWEIEGRSLSS